MPKKYKYALARKSYIKGEDKYGDSESIKIIDGEIYEIDNMSILSSSIPNRKYFTIIGNTISLNSDDFTLLTEEGYRTLKINKLIKKIKNEKSNNFIKSKWILKIKKLIKK